MTVQPRDVWFAESQAIGDSCGPIGMGMARPRCAAESARHRPSISSPRPDVWRKRKGQTTPEALPTQDAPDRGAAAPVSPLDDVQCGAARSRKRAKRRPWIDSLTPIPRKTSASRFSGVLLQEPLSLSSNAFAPSTGEVCPAKPRTLVQIGRRSVTHKLPREKRGKIRKSERKTYAKAAANCASGKVRDAVTTTWNHNEQAKHRNRKLGTFGAASEVVRINPETMEPYE